VPILKVADFGFARSLPNAMMAETLCGSPYVTLVTIASDIHVFPSRLYMAPEILRYEKYDAKADLWSVGAVLFEMAVGKPPFRAQNHVDLLKKIETSKGIKFPDEDPQRTGSDEVIPNDIKELVRGLLKRSPVERWSFQDFFGSTALARSKFPRPSQIQGASPSSPTADDDAPEDAPNSKPWSGRIPIPESHRIIPPEVLDPNVMIPPSKFNFRRRDGLLGANDVADAAPQRYVFCFFWKCVVLNFISVQ
jgi:serine/threonine-protein kinase ULK2